MPHYYTFFVGKEGEKPGRSMHYFHRKISSKHQKDENISDLSRIEGKYLISFNCKLKKDPKLGGHGIKLLNICLPHLSSEKLYFKVQSTFIVSKT